MNCALGYKTYLFQEITRFLYSVSRVIGLAISFDPLETEIIHVVCVCAKVRGGDEEERRKHNRGG